MKTIRTGLLACLALSSMLAGSAPAQPDRANLDGARTQETAEADGSESAVLFAAINVLDLEAAEAFYVDILLMKPTLRLGEEAGSERKEVTLNFSGEMSSPGASIVLNYVVSRKKPVVADALSRIAFRVPDVEAVVERARQAGHTIVTEPRIIDVKGAKFKLAFILDPDGIRVELIQPMQPSPES